MPVSIINVVKNSFVGCVDPTKNDQVFLTQQGDQMFLWKKCGPKHFIKKFLLKNRQNFGVAYDFA
jgi:hypothetical protein